LRSHGGAGAGGELALFVHAYYVDVFEEIIDRYLSENMRYPIYVTTQQDKEGDVSEILSRNKITHRIFVEENHGRDVLPFIKNAHHIQQDGFRYILKLHTKKSLHREDGAVWRNELFAEFLNRNTLERIKTMFDRNPDLGIAGPEMHILPLTDHLEENYANLDRIAARMQIDLQDALKRDSFVAGTMFFARFSSLIPILKLDLQYEDFDEEAGQLDGTLAHALERVFGVATRLNGRRVATFETIMGTRANMPSRRSFHT
ncbi:MAG: rhamnan synthesis F family protein, partial [Pseudomonadota bacterium]